MKLKHLYLENFRGYKKFNCDFEANINVLVGLNGAGKTSILDSISIAYGQYFSALGTGVDRGINEHEIHLKMTQIDDVSQMNHQFPVIVSCETFDDNNLRFPQKWQRKRTTLKGRTTQVKELKEYAHTVQQHVQQNKISDLPMFGYYGTGRLWKQKSLSSKKVQSLVDSSRLEGYRDCMDPESSYSAFAKWLKDETLVEIERKLAAFEQSGFSADSVLEKSTRGLLLLALTEAVNKVLAPSGWSNVRYSATQKDIVATHQSHGVISVSNLSDGVRNMIGVVCDIAYRCIRLNPHLKEYAVKATNGIVLIDEVDMHLHPQWQQTVVESLANAFPNIQFILTSHSPQVIGSVKPECISIIKQSESGDFYGEKPSQAFGLSSNDILNELMVDKYHTATQLSRNQSVSEKLESIYELIAQSEFEQATSEIELLQKELNGEIPELVKAKLSVELAEWDD
ncbi:hypothetical protein EAG18_06995 [Pseudoalteromonas sp. J010]|uniref:AAA family ATPase n=1 Tax=Pseudoalteromonas sp. J010 TaxID=998465 RepID=UPI000F6504B8|nr:AAA family ATPase [Pseudoalteromonas sp. J010]RRS09182.1 hypothetical protein EAG18_06995 [Pseudoalteromonas sp. J010]